MESWKQMFEEIFKETGDSFENLQLTLTKDELSKEFDSGYGGVEGMPFTGWSENFVYFPVCYDGAESIGFVSRNPNNEPSYHVGG